MASRLAYFRQHWLRTETTPILIITAGAMFGVGWYLRRLALGPHVTWDRKNNPHPWLSVQQNENVKMMSVSKDFDKSWTREKW